ncbi:MAG: hypothetical protein V1758_12395 [Pseudomonadota bacterium]
MEHRFKEESKRKHRSLWWKIVTLVVLILVMVWVRAFYGSMQDYRTGETLLKENQTIRAITYFDRSLHWYAPLNPYVERSAKRLWEIGERAEEEKDSRLALIAYESIRNGFYGVSHLFTPGEDWIRRVDKKIDGLSSLQGRGGSVPSMKDPHPGGIWSAVVVISFIGWVGSLAGFARWVIGREERPGRRLGRVVLWISLGVSFFALWILGMMFA